MDACSSCGEEMPKGECPQSKRPCGHHCNHSWSQDSCCWCKAEFGEISPDVERKKMDPLKRTLSSVLPNLITPGVFLDILRGEPFRREDWLAIPRIVLHDVKFLAANLLLDYTGPIGEQLLTEVLYRRAYARAMAFGSDFFCVTHDCDAANCPKGSHDD